MAGDQSVILLDRAEPVPVRSQVEPSAEVRDVLRGSMTHAWSAHRPLPSGEARARLDIARLWRCRLKA